MGVSTPRAAWQQRLTTDETGLLIIGVATLLRGVSYLPVVLDQERAPAHFMEQLAPAGMWAWGWLAVGVLCLVSLVAVRAQPIAVGLAVGIHFMWAVSFTVSGGRGWVSALSYGAIALMSLWAFGRGRQTPPVAPPPAPRVDPPPDGEVDACDGNQ